MGQDRTELFVCQDKSELGDHHSDQFIISEEIKSIDINRLLEYHYDLQSFRLSNTTLPIYLLFNEYLSSLRDQVGLSDCIAIYRLLEEQSVSEYESIIVSDAVNDKYVRVLEDVSEHYNIPIEYEKYDTNILNNGLFHIIFSTLYLLRTLLISIKQCTQKLDLNSRILISTMPGRTEHVAKLTDHLPDHSVISLRTSYSSLGEETVHPRSSLRSIYKSSYVYFQSVIGSQKQISEDLIEHVHSEYGIHLEHTVEFCVSNCYTAGNLSAIWEYLLWKDILGKSSSQKLLVGALDMRSKALLLAGEHNNMDTFYLPHSITFPFHPAPPRGTTFFATESLDLEYWAHRLENSSLCSENVISTGRLDLQDSTSTGQSLINGETDSNTRLLIATQPHSDRIRTSFVEDVMSALDESAMEIKPVIKTHPGEDAQFYRNLTDADVFDSHLLEEIDKSDLVCTVNSNVGAIAMSRNTPVISVNYWSPTCVPPLYAYSGPAPMLTSRSDLFRFFEELDVKRLLTAQTRQRKFFESYYLIPDSMNRIQKRIN